MALIRWTDDRLDDLHATVRANDHRLDDVQSMSQTNDRRLTDLEKHHSGVVNTRWQTAMFIAAMLSPIVTLVVVIWKG